MTPTHRQRFLREAAITSHRIALTGLLLGLISCSSTAIRETKVDATTGKVTEKVYSGYFETRSILVPGKVGVDLMVDVEKHTIPVAHQIAQSIGALGPGDMDAKGLFTAYVHNLTTLPQTITISAMHHGGQVLPSVPLTIELLPDSYQKVELGRITIFSYATELKVSISYEMGLEKLSKELVVRRQTNEEITANVARWKGKKKNVPEFFPD